MITSALLSAVLLSQGQTPLAERPLDSVLGIRIGASLQEARKVLDPLGSSGGVRTRDGGEKIAWNLQHDQLKSIAVRTDKIGLVKWVTAFYKPGSEVPFSTLGQLGQAQHTDNEAIWTVKGDPSFRVVAKGSGKKASVVYLIKI